MLAGASLRVRWQRAVWVLKMLGCHKGSCAKYALGARSSSRALLLALLLWLARLLLARYLALPTIRFLGASKFLVMSRGVASPDARAPALGLGIVVNLFCRPSGIL